MTNTGRTSGGNWTGRAVLVIVLWVVLAGGAYLIYSLVAGGGNDKSAPTPTSNSDAPTAAKTPESADRVKVGIAYGTEKKRWLTAAVEAFNQTPDGKKYEIDLLPMGSVEGAQAVVNGDERIDVWSPASAMYREAFEADWSAQHGSGKPILREETLALSPMVFVFWDERYQAFHDKLGDATFPTIAAAASDPTGWQGIAGKSDWGYFKFGHTHPGKSNSGLMTLVLMAYDFADKYDGLSNADVLTPEFQAYLAKIERNVRDPIDSTGTLMRDFVLKGPSVYDAIMVYENVAMDYLENAKGRWGEIKVVYPQRNIWNDNPYYVLDVPWSNKQQKAGAAAFLEFLMGEPMQRLALSHGFRPGNPAVATNDPDSPLTKYAPYGVRQDVGRLCAFPPASVLKTLQEGWERQFGGR